MKPLVLFAVLVGLGLVSTNVQALLPNPWAAIGRLDIEGERFCTGTVISDYEVLTAAHCLFEPESGELVALSDIVFQVGLFDDETIRRAVPSAARFRDGYLPQSANELGTLERDIAVLEFGEPLGAPPLALHPDRGWPEMLSAARYGRSRPYRVTVDHGCKIGTRLGRLWQITCLGESGNSGGPLLAPSAAGPRVAGVIVAVRTDARRSWMLAVPLHGGSVLPPGLAAALER